MHSYSQFQKTKYAYRLQSKFNCINMIENNKQETDLYFYFCIFRKGVKNLYRDLAYCTQAIKYLFLIIKLSLKNIKISLKEINL